MSQRLTRKEIKRNVLADWVAQALEFVRGHGRGLVLGIGAVVAVALVAGGVVWWLRAQSAEANELLSRAIRVAAAPTDASADAAKPDDLKEPSFSSEEARRAKARELFEEVAGMGAADAAVVAQAYLGQLALADGDREAARQSWEAFLDDASGHFLAGEVRVNLMKLDREDGKLAEVADELRAMLGAEEPPLPGDVILWELGTTLEEMGEAEEASDTFQRLVDEYPRSAYRGEAQQRTSGAVNAGFPTLGG